MPTKGKSADLIRRKKYSEAQNVALLAQVEGLCPLCSRNLFRIKKDITYKDYEVAHIYPLNPTAEETKLLINEEQLSKDVNHEDNVIPLCKQCHGEFDNPRTVEEYRQLVAIKKKLIKGSKLQSLWSGFSLEKEITQVIESLYSSDFDGTPPEISYDPKAIDSKLGSGISSPTKRKIKFNVAEYFEWIRLQLSNLDKSTIGSSQIISTQIKAFFLKQKQLGSSQQEIFEAVVKWIEHKAKPETTEAAEIVASFFVQNCEIFE